MSTSQKPCFGFFHKIIAFCILMFISFPLCAQQTQTTGDGGYRINLAGRQRTLSQLMVKSACFAALGVDAQAHISEFLQAHATFDKILKELQLGSQARGLKPETHPDILKSLQILNSLWASYGPLLKLFAEHYRDPNAQARLQEIYKLDFGFLLEVNEVVSHLESKYGLHGDTQHAKLAAAINVAGRQRMLSQKMAKEFCMVVSGYEPSKTRPLLLGSIALFEATQASLIRGVSGLDLPSAISEQLRARLGSLDPVWLPIGELLNKPDQGSSVAQADIVKIAKGNHHLLAQANEIVKFYETLYAAGENRRKLN